MPGPVVVIPRQDPKFDGGASFLQGVSLGLRNKELKQREKESEALQAYREESLALERQNQALRQQEIDLEAQAMGYNQQLMAHTRLQWGFQQIPESQRTQTFRLWARSSGGQQFEEATGMPIAQWAQEGKSAEELLSESRAKIDLIVSEANQNILLGWLYEDPETGKGTVFNTAKEAMDWRQGQAKYLMSGGGVVPSEWQKAGAQAQLEGSLPTDDQVQQMANAQQRITEANRLGAASPAVIAAETTKTRLNERAKLQAYLDVPVPNFSQAQEGDLNDIIENLVVKEGMDPITSAIVYGDVVAGQRIAKFRERAMKKGTPEREVYQAVKRKFKEEDVEVTVPHTGLGKIGGVTDWVGLTREGNQEPFSDLTPEKQEVTIMNEALRRFIKLQDEQAEQQSKNQAELSFMARAARQQLAEIETLEERRLFKKELLKMRPELEEYGIDMGWLDEHTD